jgi:protein associated with RNAse G/E
MDSVVHIDFRKWPDTKHWQFSMNRLGEDEHGVWLWSRPGMVIRRGEEPPRINRSLSVKIITHTAWWTAIWNDRADGEHLYVDIATPATWVGDKVTLIDLDLDVYRTPDGLVTVLDEDEFEEHRITLGYPDHIVDKTRTATAGVVLDVEAERDPFGAVAATWLERARDLWSSS